LLARTILVPIVMFFLCVYSSTSWSPLGLFLTILSIFLWFVAIPVSRVGLLYASDDMFYLRSSFFLQTMTLDFECTLLKLRFVGGLLEWQAWSMFSINASHDTTMLAGGLFNLGISWPCFIALRFDVTIATKFSSWGFFVASRTPMLGSIIIGEDGKTFNSSSWIIPSSKFAFSFSFTTSQNMSITSKVGGMFCSLGDGNSRGGKEVYPNALGPPLVSTWPSGFSIDYRATQSFVTNTPTCTHHICLTYIKTIHNNLA